MARVGSPVKQLTSDGRSLAQVPPDSLEEPGAVYLGQVARDAIDILSSPLSERIKACANPVCQAVFLDLSRPNSRRWCSMGEGGCGNRAKTRARRGRLKESPIKM
nr:CGNR zinc finger domain-containing protein [Burkholderia sp. THE68]